MEATYLAIILAGLAGGAIRGLVGFVKHQYAYKNVPFKLKYFFAMVSISGVIGLVTALVIKEIGMTFLGVDYLTPALAVIVGYAGGDIIENVYKIILRKSSLYKLPEFK